MATIYRILAILLIPLPVLGQLHGPNTPDSLSFQGYLTDIAGVPISAPTDMTFKLYKGSNEIWSQTQSGVSVSNGVFNVVLGGVGLTSLDTVAFNEPIDLGITIGGNELVPRTPLVAAAYALGMRGMYSVAADDGTNNAPNLVGGASNNFVTAGVVGASIGGGGGQSHAFGVPNAVTGDWGTVSGGQANTSGQSATVGGGYANTAGTNGATIGGGGGNFATGQFSTVGGGSNNSASGDGATVGGGFGNQARGDFSVAAGYSARAKHEGSFVWNDRSVTSGDDSLVSTAANQFLIRAAGGVGIGTNAINPGLTIARPSQAAAYQLELRNAGSITAPNFDGILFTQDLSGGTELASIKVNYHNDGNPDMLFSVRGATDALAIERVSGDVGIGTTSPGSRLAVNGMIESETLGFKFPDGTVQTTAAGSGAFWSLTGNSGTNPSTNFIGTSDSTALEFRINNRRRLRIEPASDPSGTAIAPNVIAGASNNFVGAGAIGATIGGGGGRFSPNDVPNSVLSPWGTVSGGSGNTASDFGATVAGGDGNSASGGDATVAGGLRNSASADVATVSGGLDNSASGAYAAVSGGNGNSASGFFSSVIGGGDNSASGTHSTVLGGYWNKARGENSLAAGYKARAVHEGSFVWNDRSVTSLNDSLVTTAANQFLIRAAGGVGIGTASPNQEVTIFDAGGDGDALLNLKASSPAAREMLIGVNQSFGGFISMETNDALGFRTNGTTWVVIDQTGNTRFEGDAYPRTSNLFSLGRSGNTWSEVWANDGSINTSDRRLKQDIRPIDYGLTHVMDLEPVSFRWISRPEAGVRLGLIAQEVAEVIPEVVRGSETGDQYLGLNYSELVPVLIKAIQEQQAIIESQDQRLAAIEARLTN